MQYRQLGRTDLNVSLIGLGTMTWGRQNTQEEGFEQMDYALTQGINFFDTAEMYAVPPTPDTYGKTETIIGNWFASRKNRDKVILASKIAGPGMEWVREGNNFIDRKNILLAVEDSLKRLQTDYIDLYQLHWPERETKMFGTRDYIHNSNDKWEDNVYKPTTSTFINCIGQTAVLITLVKFGTTLLTLTNKRLKTTSLKFLKPWMSLLRQAKFAMWVYQMKLLGAPLNG